MESGKCISHLISENGMREGILKTSKKIKRCVCHPFPWPPVMVIEDIWREEASDGHQILLKKIQLSYRMYRIMDKKGMKKGVVRERIRKDEDDDSSVSRFWNASWLIWSHISHEGAKREVLKEREYNFISSFCFSFTPPVHLLFSSEGKERRGNQINPL